MFSKEYAIDGDNELGFLLLEKTTVGDEAATETERLSLMEGEEEEEDEDATTTTSLRRDKQEEEDCNDDDDASCEFVDAFDKFLERISKVIGRLSEKIDLFLSPDGKTRPRVSMVTNLCHVIWPCLVAALALFMVNQWISQRQQLYRRGIQLYLRLTTVASVFLLSSVYVLGVKKIPSGMALIVGGVHAFLMNRDIGEFWPAWIVASLWALSAAAFLYHENKQKKNEDASSPSLSHDVAIWAVYTNLFCLSLPNITGFGGQHDPALLARSSMLLVGAALGHPSFQLLGFATVVCMVLDFFFPGNFGIGTVDHVLWNQYYHGASVFW